MCGIWISLGLRPDRANLDIIAHRGPDGEGWREFETPRGTLCFGHRRLAIIDTGEGGVQPMSYGQEKYWITYNGEIYNYVELREELSARGYKFATASDTEVALAAYTAWGKDALPRLRGMFALAIYDREAGRILFARDRFGIKPLYIARSANSFAASSEIKQLLTVPGVTRRINRRRAYDFLAGGLLDHATETMFADVFQLAPGSWLEIDLSSQEITQGAWYQLPAPGSLKIGSDEAAARFLALLQDAVSKHLRADVDVGSCLSGGLDSSALVMLMSEQLEVASSSGLLNTVTARFEGTSVDETGYADLVTETARARGHAARPRPEDVLSEAREIVWHQDEPYGSTSIHAQWHVFKAARANGLKVMLDGQGADEILAGYHGVYDFRLLELGRQLRLVAALRLATQRAQMQNVPVRVQMRLLAGALAQSGPAVVRAPLGAAAWLRKRGRAMKGVSVAPWLEAQSFDTERHYDVFQRAVADAKLPAPLGIGDLCAALTTVGNVRMLLHWEDRNSMAHGVEARVPFLDHPLVEFAIALGGEHKLVDGWTKWILRKSMKGRLPDAVRERKDKLGFATPETEWMRGPLRAEYRDAVLATQKRFPEHFPRSALTAMVDDMLDGRRPMEFAPWRVACFGIWSEKFGTSF